MTQMGSRPAQVKSSEDRSEGALSMKVIGYGAILCALLVVFFLPAGFRTGHAPAFFTIVAVLALAGLSLVIAGAVRSKV